MWWAVVCGQTPIQDFSWQELVNIIALRKEIIIVAVENRKGERGKFGGNDLNPCL